MKTILLHVAQDDSLQHRLSVATRLVRALRGHLTCVQATLYQSFLATDAFGGTYPIPEALQYLRSADEL